MIDPHWRKELIEKHGACCFGGDSRAASYVLDCPDGWANLVASAAMILHWHKEAGRIKDFVRFVQIKSKWNYACFYVNDNKDRFEDGTTLSEFVNALEAEANSTCDRCGNLGTAKFVRYCEKCVDAVKQND